MPPVQRPHKKSVRLSDEEDELHIALARHLGIDETAVLRQGLLKLARDEGFTLPDPKPTPPPAKKRIQRKR